MAGLPHPVGVGVAVKDKAAFWISDKKMNEKIRRKDRQADMPVKVTRKECRKACILALYRVCSRSRPVDQTRGK